MDPYIKSRTIDIAQYIIEHNSTVRDAAKQFGLAKSVVHTDMTNRLIKIDVLLYDKVNKVLQNNKKERHLRGGNATKNKYLNIKKTNE